MSEIIKNALKSLDLENDNHWTADGLPRLETVRFLTGNATLNRETVYAACPTFCRGNPVVDGNKDGKAPDVNTVVVATPGDAILAKVAEDLSVSDLEKAIAELTVHLDEARTAKDTTAAVYARLMTQMDLLVLERDKEIPTSANNALNYQAYLERQKEIREGRAEKLNQIQESGLSEMIKQLSSPIDSALKNRKKK